MNMSDPVNKVLLSLLAGLFSYLLNESFVNYHMENKITLKNFLIVWGLWTAIWLLLFFI